MSSCDCLVPPLAAEVGSGLEAANRPVVWEWLLKGPMSWVAAALESLLQQRGFSLKWLGWYLALAVRVLGQGDSPLVGVWTVDEGFQTVDLLFRSDGRYQIDTRSTDPGLDFASAERGRYEVNSGVLALMPYDYFGELTSRLYGMELIGSSLVLASVDLGVTQIYSLKPGSRADVLARQNVAPSLIGTWERGIVFAGKSAYTFRPGGYFFRKETPEDAQFPPEYIRGRYVQEGLQLAIRPYSGVEARFELDFFGNVLTLIQGDDMFGQSQSFELVPGSTTEVMAKSAEAEAFLHQEHWQVGVWQMGVPGELVELSLRPDGHYFATNQVEILRGIVRGRYTLEPGRIQFVPFVGQGLYSRDNGDFGKVERTRELDYYDGELQLINPEALSQAVTIARKLPGTKALVMEKATQAEAQRSREDWPVGIWEVNDPAGWMQFTFRPDGRYIAQSGAVGSPSQVERGRYHVGANKFTLAPYAGLGEARGFEFDLYDGTLFLAGDLSRLVVARKQAGTEAGVVEKTLHPEALRGELGPILGRWTANRPGEFVELVFRTDGQFRLSRCANDIVSQDYGLCSIGGSARNLVYDSRFAAVQTQGLDYYGDTLTIHGGFSATATYTVNRGTAAAAIESSFAADDARELVDGEWLTRVAIGPRDPNSIVVPTVGLPVDPHPERTFDVSTVFTTYRLYRRLISTFVHFDVLGTIKSVAVVNTREWHFFPNGRVLVRFKNHQPGFPFPTTFVDVADTWGAYSVGGDPTETDILHLYADNGLFIETDAGERSELTLEDGRRNLFWEKDYMILQDWASEQKNVPCQLPENPDASLLNTGLTLTTQIEPDPIPDPERLEIRLTGPAEGRMIVSGAAAVAGRLVIEQANSLAVPMEWHAVQTNNVPVGPFQFSIPAGTNPQAYFRLRGE